MMRTATNVAGQAALTTVVAAREGILDRSVYESPKTEDSLGDAPVTTPEREAVAA